MSHYMTALAMRQTGLKPAAKIVLYWLSDHHNSDTDLCCPSLRTLCQEAEMSRPSVVRCLDELERLGFIFRSKTHRENGAQSSNQYELRLEDTHENRRLKNDTGGVKKRYGGGYQIETPITLEEVTLESNQEDSICDDFFTEIEDAETQESKPDPFDTFWAAYPASVRKTDKVAARKVFRSITLGKHKDHPKVLAADLIDGATRYRRSEPDPKFVPLPATWLNKGRWANTASASDTSATSSTGGHRYRPPQGEVIR